LSDGGTSDFGDCHELYVRVILSNLEVQAGGYDQFVGFPSRGLSFADEIGGNVEISPRAPSLGPLLRFAFASVRARTGAEDRPPPAPALYSSEKLCKEIYARHLAAIIS
jgi:hypothetical protein